MIENLANTTFQNKIKGEFSLDELLLNNFLLSDDQKSEKNFKSNILITSLQDFNKRCLKSYGKSFYEKNYLVSLNEIITLIKNSIIAQQHLDKYIYFTGNSEQNSTISKIKELNEKFLNELNYNIFSLEKINNDYSNIIEKKKRNSENKKINKSKHFNTPYNIKNKINSIFNDLAKEVFLNENEKLNSNYGIKEIKTNNEKNINSRRERNKSEKSNSANNISLFNKKIKNVSNKKIENKKIKKNIISSYNTRNEDKNNISKNSNGINEKNSMNNINSNYNLNQSSNLINEDKNFYNYTNREMANNSQNRNSILKINSTSKTTKSNKNLKSFDIFKICQNLKKDKQKKSNASEPIIRANSSHCFNDINELNDYILKNTLKSLGFSQTNDKQKLYAGIKKIIVSNAFKPSNFTNQLLNKGKKYISDFKKMDEESKKWK